MGNKTTIEYVDYSWSPWQGCQPVSPGCAHCYMLALMKRWGKDGTKRTLTKDWKKPTKWNKQAAKLGACPRVLVSMCDPFDGIVPQVWFDVFLNLVSDTPHLTWLVLTKRPENIALRLNAAELKLPDNVWLGVSVEDQQRADERIPILLSIPARVRFISVEPLLGPVDLGLLGTIPREICPQYTFTSDKVHWVIVGGESGHNHRKCEIEWIQSVADQCREADVQVFVKQDSHRLPGQQGRIPDDLWAIKQIPNP